MPNKTRPEGTPQPNPALQNDEGQHSSVLGPGGKCLDSV